MRFFAAFAAVAGLVLFSLPAVGGEPAPRSLQIIPEQQIPLTFSHTLHRTSGVACVVCHGSVQQSVQAADDNLPDHTICGLCHRMEQPAAAEMYPKAACSTCHEGFTDGTHEHVGPAPTFAPVAGAPRPAPVVIEAARLHFSHQLHLNGGIECTTCHEGIENATKATRAHLPGMDTCLTCHNGREAPDACTTCHLQGDGGRVRTDLGEAWDLLKPSGRFRPDDHFQDQWIRHHEAAARVDEESCNSCHKPQECLDCHDGVAKVRELHPADWVMTHGLEAMRTDLNCRSCHDAGTFCRDCHTRAGVKPGSFPGRTSDPPGNLQFHPEGWGGLAGEIPGAEHHSHQARRSLQSCESCHAQDDCLECHVFVNPHPRGWSEAPDNFRFGQGDGEVCMTCHQPGDPDVSRVGR
jgi:c(7)-type cytochrome triheme protein